MRILRRLADVVAVPWANGGGLTSELLGYEEAARLTPEATRWRLSVAELRGPAEFSSLFGIDRTFVAVGGDVDLRIDGTVHTCGAGEALRFRGDQETALVSLDTPCRALNLMAEWPETELAVELWTGPGTEFSAGPPASGTGFVCTTLEDSGEFPRFTALLLDTPAEAAALGRVAVVRVLD